MICLPWTNPFYTALNTHQKLDENNLSGTAKVSYNWTPDVLTYASYARGFKDGGFNLDRITSGNGKPNGGIGFTPVTDTSFPAETVDSYEAGVKTTWLHGKLLLNLTLFDEEYQHFQLNSFLGTSFVVESIPKVSSKGVDGEYMWLTPMQGLTFQGGFTYADTRYDHFGPDQLTNPTDFMPIGSVGLSLLPGARISFAPDWSISSAMNFERPLSDRFRFLFNLSAKYLSDYNTGSEPRAVQGAAGLYAREHPLRPGLGRQPLAGRVLRQQPDRRHLQPGRVRRAAAGHVHAASAPPSTAPRPTPRPTTPSWARRAPTA